MFGSFIGSGESAQPDFGAKMLNTVASQSIRRLFSECKEMNVDIRCSPSSKILQGSVDSVKMQGSGLVIRRQFRVEDMSFETDAIAIDFGSVLKGQIRLKQPTQAIAQIVLSEAGINEAFSGELVKKRLDRVTLSLDPSLGIESPVSFEDISVKLLPNNQIEIHSKVVVPERGTVPIAVRTTLAVERRRRLLFNSPQFQEDVIPEEAKALSKPLTAAFVEILNNMVDLDRFDLDGVELRINRVETQQQQLLFSGYAQIEQFPAGAS
jgi:LmeA-like phospholipid-binding